MRNLKVFVYGTLRQGNANSRLLHSAEFVGDAIAPGKLWMYHNLPIAEQTDDAQLVGEVYNVTPEQLLRLDALEGHPDWYRREAVQVELTSGETVQAWLYYMPDAELERYDDDRREVLGGDYNNPRFAETTSTAT